MVPQKIDEVIELYPTESGQYSFKPMPKVNLLEKVSEPERKKPTYPQNWPAYDAAKTNESVFFKKLLQELLILTGDELVRTGVGRKPFTTKEKIFAMAIKTYFRSDLRKCQSILKELKELHYIDRTPSFKSIDNFFNDTKISEILDDLILISALPLAELEETGAIDSTGFSTSRFDRWFDYRYGTIGGKERVWRKAHASIACKTNVFLSIHVTEKNVADVSVFEKVVGNLPKLFEMRTFVADKAYSSRRVLGFLYDQGVIPYIPFKSNASSLSHGVGIWNRMYHLYKKKNKLFLQEYHRRSNVETSFHMVKQRFGDSLKTKSFEANVNEIKIRFLSHNLCVLIQEAYESDIFINFESCVKTAHSV